MASVAFPTDRRSATHARALAAAFSRNAADQLKADCPAFSYEWYRNTTRIATGETYTLAAVDVGARIRVKVTGSSTGYTTASRYSAYTATVR